MIALRDLDSNNNNMKPGTKEVFVEKVVVKEGGHRCTHSDDDEAAEESKRNVSWISSHTSCLLKANILRSLMLKIEVPVQSASLVKEIVYLFSLGQDLAANTSFFTTGF